MHRVEALLGASLAGQQKFADGEAHLLSGYKGMQTRATATLEKERLRETGACIVELYENWSKSDKASAWRSRLADPQ
jgi:hypothetical protein